jgi:hypothetical protein
MADACCGGSVFVERQRASDSGDVRNIRTRAHAHDMPLRTWLTYDANGHYRFTGDAYADGHECRYQSYWSPCQCFGGHDLPLRDLHMVLLSETITSCCDVLKIVHYGLSLEDALNVVSAV